MKAEMRILATLLVLFCLHGGVAAEGMNQYDLMFHPVTQGGGHQHGQPPGRSSGKLYMLMNGADSEMRMWKPDGSIIEMTVAGDHFNLPKTGVDNYHAVGVERHSQNLREFYIRYIYRRGKPSGHSPAEILAINKSDLEIFPDPLPREHRDYQSGETWPFIVRFRGEPLSGAEVVLSTFYGGISTAVSDKEGRVLLHLPDDFPDMVEGERDERKADFAVTAEHQDGDNRYRSHLGAEYEPNPRHWQSRPLGFLVIGIGMLAGGFLGRVRRRESKGKL